MFLLHGSIAKKSIVQAQKNRKYEAWKGRMSFPLDDQTGSSSSRNGLLSAATSSSSLMSPPFSYPAPDKTTATTQGGELFALSFQPLGRNVTHAGNA